MPSNKILDLHSGRLEKIFNIDINCKYCGEVLENDSISSIHNFLRYYDERKTQPVLEKSIIQERIGDIKIYRISFDRHSNEYNSFDSDSVIENFLTNFRSRFNPVTNGMAKNKHSLSVINIQPLTNGYDVSLSSLRYLTK